MTQRLAAIKRERAEMGFDDLLRHVAKALSAPAGPQLAERLRGEYPLALIDEFQDTDAVQYGIFEAIYPRGLTHNSFDQALGLYLIGDPKQAIYRFRGADIHTYLAAAQSCSDKHTLAINFRSSDAVVETVNALFEAADAPFGMDGELPFEPVRPSGKIAPLCDAAGRAQAPLRLLLHEGGDDGKALKSGEANPWAARACAALIGDQLRAGRSGDLWIDGEPLQAGQLAVLVRTNAQARAVALQLRALDIPSVVGVRESVFASVEALDMQHWLALMHQPGDERALRRVLASPLGGVPAATLADLDAGDVHWLDHRQQVSEAARLFRRAGPLAALMRQLADWRCAARLGGRPGGERALTNYLQLGELLQGAAAEHRGLDSLISWYQRLMSDPGSGGEVARQRLETDSKLVQIVTQHASKGLEYPLVYLPFLNPPQDKTGQRDRLPVLCQSAAGPVADFGGEDFAEHKARAQVEEGEERMRLFYVALTRASRQLTLIGGHIRESERSALAALLGATGKDDNLAQRLRAWAGGRAGVELLDEPDAVTLPPLDEVPVSVARGDAVSPVPGWAMSSYTALVRDAHGGHAAEEPDHDGAAAAQPAESPADSPAAGPVDEVFAFPRGAQAGTCLHELFEQLDFATSDSAAVSTQVQSSLAGHGFPTRWAPAIEQLVEHTLDTALTPVPGLSLRRIGAADRLVEMGFHCPLDALSAAALNALLREHGFFADAGALDFATVRGYIKGFVDLIFRFEGRWYICDYKSNHLGDRVSDYHAPALRAAMASHHYGLQYLLYTVALHRYLEGRLPGYDYERHMGGCFYLFLRGLRAGDPKSPGVYFDRPARALVEALDALLAGSVA